MKTWREALRDSLVTGSVAGATTLAALALRGRSDDGSAVAPINATSHVLWGDEALRENRATMRHTLPGVLINLASTVFWGALYEKLFGGRKQSAAQSARDTALFTAGAAVVDLVLVPKRVTPGFEHRLSRTSLTLVYGALALGLAVGHHLVERRS